MGVCPCVKRNFEYDDAKTNVKRYGGEGRLGGFEATFLSSYLACSAVPDVESWEKKKKRGIVLAQEPTISRGGTRVIRRGRKENTTAIVHEGFASPCVYLQIFLRERFDRGANGGQNVGVVGSEGEDGRGKGGGSRSMNEAECVLAIANGLCQAFRDLATAVLNPRAATRYLRDRWRTFRGPA